VRISLCNRARAIAPRAGSTGALLEKPDDAAWFKENADKKTHLTGTKKPNAFGLCDLVGNVWEYSVEFHSGPEYRPVLRGGAWTTPGSELRFAARQEIRPEWFERDPNRPRSMWWLTDGPFIGFRLVRFAEPAGKNETILVGPLKVAKAANTMMRISGQVKNTGTRAVEEVELTVYFLDADGKPMYEDGKARPTFSKVWPVLVNSDQPGAHRAPLKPGESRDFEVEIPQAFEVDTDPDKAGAKVSALKYPN